MGVIYKAQEVGLSSSIGISINQGYTRKEGHLINNALCLVSKGVECNHTAKHKLTGEFLEFLRFCQAIEHTLHAIHFRNPDILKENTSGSKNLHESESERLTIPGAYKIRNVCVHSLCIGIGVHTTLLVFTLLGSVTEGFELCWRSSPYLLQSNALDF